MTTTSKKIIIGLAVIIVLLLCTITVLIFKSKSPSLPAASIINENNYDHKNIIGAWYSDRPDTLTFNEDGTYTGNGKWLNSGTYTIEKDMIITDGFLDGTKTLKIVEDTEGNTTITAYQHTYFRTKGEQEKKMEDNSILEKEEEQNATSTTQNNLIGSWTSIDKKTTLIFTENTYIINHVGGGIVPPDTQTFKYKILTEKTFDVMKEDSIKPITVSFALTEKDGGFTLHSTAFAYAYTFKKDAAESATEEEQQSLSDEEQTSDIAKYKEELAAQVDTILIGTWKGTFDDFITENTVYWSYVFKEDKTYSFSDGKITETGTYITAHDPTNNDYHSSITLKSTTGERIIQFYLSAETPFKLVTDDKTDPTFQKE